MYTAERKKTVRSIVLFSFLVTGVAFLAPLLGGSPSSFGPGFILWGAAPLLVAVLLRTVTHDWSDAGLRPGFRKNAGWYLFVLVACPALAGINLLIGKAFSVSSLTGFAFSPYLQMVLPGLAMFFLFAIFEEFGWRGYLAPKLASLGINPYLGYAVTALVWATWHLPYIRELSWVYSAEDLVTFLPRFYLYTFAYSILWNELRQITSSVWPVVLLHALTNAVQHPLAADFLKITPGLEPFFAFNGFLIIVATGLLGIAIQRWHTRKSSQSESFA